MDLKDFLKPDLKKIIVLVFIILLVIILANTIFCSYPSTGYPLPIYKIVNLGVPGGPAGPLSAELDFVNIIIDLIIWYLISCFVAFVYKSFKH